MTFADQSDWPKERVGGWAPGMYFCRCKECRAEYMGDKRSWLCYPCTKNAGPTPDYTGEGSAWVPPVEARAAVGPELTLHDVIDIVGCDDSKPWEIITSELNKKLHSRSRAIPAGRVPGEGMVAVDRRIIEKFTTGCHEWMPGLGRCGDQYPGEERQLCSKCTPLRDALRANQGGADHGAK